MQDLQFAHSALQAALQVLQVHAKQMHEWAFFVLFLTLCQTMPCCLTLLQGSLRARNARQAASQILWVRVNNSAA